LFLSTVTRATMAAAPVLTVLDAIDRVGFGRSSGGWC
jgi:hypothetical protein